MALLSTNYRTGAPYLVEKKSSDGKPLFGNDRFEGYSVDLIDGISKLLNFSYEFYLVADNRYGSYNPATKQWDGLIRELRDRVGNLYSMTFLNNKCILIPESRLGCVRSIHNLRKENGRGFHKPFHDLRLD